MQNIDKIAMIVAAVIIVGGIVFAHTQKDEGQLAESKIRSARETIDRKAQEQKMPTLIVTAPICTVGLWPHRFVIYAAAGDARAAEPRESIVSRPRSAEEAPICEAYTGKNPNITAKVAKCTNAPMAETVNSIGSVATRSSPDLDGTWGAVSIGSLAGRTRTRAATPNRLAAKKGARKPHS